MKNSDTLNFLPSLLSFLILKIKVTKTVDLFHQVLRTPEVVINEGEN